MDSSWSDDKARGLQGLDLLIYLSHLIGADPGLVIWGGGNTSIKNTQPDFRGRDTRTLLIKSSGSDLKTAGPQDFVGLRLDDIEPLFELDSMPDEEIVSYLEHCALDPRSNRPSIETLLHSFIPATVVAHSHADAVIALTNTPSSDNVLRDVYGDSIAVAPYIRPGFRLSKMVGELVRQHPAIKGVVLANHGLFTWGDTAKTAYDNHIDLVSQAEDYAQWHAAGKRAFGIVKTPAPDAQTRHRFAAAIAPTIRGAVGRRPQGVLRYDDSPDVLELVGSTLGREVSGIGPATPDHIIQTKRLPLWLECDRPEDIEGLLARLPAAVEKYADDYHRWHAEHSLSSHVGDTPMLDPYPRVVLVPGVGMWTTGLDARASLITGDIYHHTIDVMRSAQGIGGYNSLSAKDAFEAEYWPLEMYKLGLAPRGGELAGRVALVTGAAAGIGRAIALRLASEGAHVVVTDIHGEGAQAVATQIVEGWGLGRGLSLSMDVTSQEDVAAAFHKTVLAYGGLDILVSNAGIAPTGAIHEMPLALWQKALDVNTTGHFLAAQEAVKIMRQQGLGGNLVFIGTKNVPAPGGDFGAYSASKAAEVQLARVLAIENGGHGIRCNIINPDAIFEGSGLWSREVREQRAQAHNVAVTQLEDFYRQRNLLKQRVLAEDVAEAALYLACDRSAKTTGAMIPVDGGVREAFPR